MRGAPGLPQELPSVEEARARAREILDDAGYRQVVDATQANPLTRWLLERWLDLQDWLYGLRTDNPVAYGFLVLGLLALLALLVTHIVWSWMRYRRAAAELPGGDLERAADPRAALSEALAAAEAQGQWTEALAYRFRITLLDLMRAEPGRVRPGHTNRELLRIWEDRPAQRARLQQVVGLLDRTWYAQRPCPSEDYHQAAAALRELTA